MNPGKKYIIIIGAGPSGLAALKAVLDSHEWRKDQWEVVALEARAEVGGIWCVSLKYGLFSV
jgi:cation diffusion facilitator CzcD-associated flavoprotein CzcO